MERLADLLDDALPGKVEGEAGAVTDFLNRGPFPSTASHRLCLVVGMLKVWRDRTADPDRGQDTKSALGKRKPQTSTDSLLREILATNPRDAPTTQDRDRRSARPWY